MYTCLVYVNTGHGHTRIKVDVPEDNNWEELKKLEILPAIIHLLQERGQLIDNARIKIEAIDILWQYIIDHVIMEQIEDLMSPQE